MQSLSKWVFMAISLLWVSLSQAERVVPVPALTAYQQECSVCHFAYPPGLLPPNSWRNITDALPKHFATNVLLNSDTSGVIASWLQTNAINPDWVGTQMPPDDRITRSDWWQQIHKPSKKLTAKVWKSPYVKSPANCAACHRGAPNGEYNAKTVLIPS